MTKEDAEIMDRVYNRELDPISVSEKIFEEIQDRAEGYDPGRREPAAKYEPHVRVMTLQRASPKRQRESRGVVFYRLPIPYSLERSD